MNKYSVWAALAVATLAYGTTAHAQTGGTYVRGTPQAMPAAPAVPAPANGLAKFEPAGDRVFHGASVPGTWEAGKLRNSLQEYQKHSGKRLSLITWYASTYENSRLTSWRINYSVQLDQVKRAGALSLIKYSVQDSNYYSTKKIASLKHINLGVFDDYYKEFAATVRDFGDPVFISINHEMNGTWYPFSEAFPGSGVTAADFVGAWRRIVDIFRQEGANNVAWVWSPNVPDVGPVANASYYPGDNYVDWVGCSFYSGNPISNLNLIYRQYAARKPIFITEWATGVEKNKYYPGFPGEAKWVDDFFKALALNYPRVKAISWFQWDKDDGNYLLQRVPAQAQVYAADIQNPRYLDNPAEFSKLPPGGLQPPPRLEVPAKEIIFKEPVPVVTPPVVTPPVEAPKRERIKLQIVPTGK